jgi:hypothetical protein
VKESSNWTEFKAAYNAGKQEVEKLQRPFSLAWAVGLGLFLVLAFQCSRWLAVKFSLSGGERFALDFVFVIPVMVVFLILRWGTPIKRTKL